MVVANVQGRFFLIIIINITLCPGWLTIPKVTCNWGWGRNALTDSPGEQVICDGVREQRHHPVEGDEL